MTQVERAIEQLRAAIEAEVAAAEKRGAAQAAADFVAKMQAAIGVEQPKKRGRKPKG